MDITAHVRFVAPKELAPGMRILWNDLHQQLRWGTVIRTAEIDRTVFPRSITVTVAPGTAAWGNEVSFAIWTKVAVVINEHAVPHVRDLTPKHSG